jgi:hypothetical protein
VAAAPEARGLGVLVVLNDEIQAAREVTKASTLRLETFRSADLGMLGYADPDGRVAIYRRPARRHAPDTEFDVRGRRDLPRVEPGAGVEPDASADEASAFKKELENQLAQMQNLTKSFEGPRFDAAVTEAVVSKDMVTVEQLLVYQFKLIGNTPPRSQRCSPTAFF